MSNKKNKIHVVIIIILVILLITSIVLAYINAIGNPFSMSTISGEETPREALGTFGDYIGGVLNPTLAFVSFIALLYTLKLNQEELNETRKELKRAADAQQESQKLRNEQLTTQFLQQFDSFFSMLLNQLHHKIEAIRQDRVLDDLHKNMEKDLSRDEIWYVQELKNLFNFIYLALDSVAKNIVLNNTFDESEQMRLKNKYWNIIRSMIPEKVMHLMIKDCIDYAHDPKVKRYKPLIEQADFFENISFYGLSPNQKFWLIWAATKFVPQTFGENYGYAQIKQTLAFELIHQVNIGDLESFVLKILQNSELIHSNISHEDNLVEVGLVEDIHLTFDYAQNKNNPDLRYIDQQLQAIELLPDSIQLLFGNSESIKSGLNIKLIERQHGIQIDTISKLEY